MSRRRSASGVALAASVLSACSPSVREWWTEDLRDRPPVIVAHSPAPYFAPTHADRSEERGAQARPPRPMERRASPPPRPPAPLTAYAAPRPTREIPPPPITTRPQPPANIPAARVPARPIVPDRLSPPQTASLAPLAPPMLEAAPLVPEAVPLEIPIIPSTVVSLVGMTEEDVRRLLGAPRTQVDRGTQKVWTYTGADCSIEVIFFRDLTRGSYAALDHKTLGADGRTPSPYSCLRASESTQSTDGP